VTTRSFVEGDGTIKQFDGLIISDNGRK